MRRTRLEQWEGREAGVLGALPYALLALCVAATLVIGEPDVNGPVLAVVVLSAVAAAWMLWWTVLHPGWKERPGLMGVYFAGLIALMAALVVLAPWYGFFTFTGYFSVILLPGVWRPVGVLCVAVVTGTSQAGGLPDGSAESIGIYALVLAVNVAVAGTITFFAWVGEEGHRKRARLVEQLETTLRENEALQEELLARAREDGVAGERQRMAREIHDTIAQGLTGIITQLEAAEQAREPAERARHVQAARSLARDSLTEARRSVHAMRPEQLEGARLPDALAGEARRWSALHGVRADVTTTGAARALAPEVEVTLLRAAQEALANVAKHAEARRVGVTLSYMDDGVTLDVRDDGVGFAVHGRAAGAHGDGDSGFGLLGMRQRVAGLDGSLAIESEPGAGTALSLSVPT